MSKLKKEIYPFTEVGAMLFEKYPGHYLNIKSAIATVNTHARELGIGDINGKKSYRKMTAKDAERVLASVATSLSPRDAATPIERAIRDANGAIKKTTTQDIINKAKITARDMKKYVEMKYGEKKTKEPEPTPTETVVDKMTETKRSEVDDFELIRKKFYTDFKYFTKYAETPEERLAILNALANLYGLGKSIRFMDALRAINKEGQT